MSEEVVEERGRGSGDGDLEEGESSSYRPSEASRSSGSAQRSRGSRGRLSKRRSFQGDRGTFGGKRRRVVGGVSELPFLHGGNRKDPLNLESIRPVDDTENMKPLEIIIPKNMRDPLNLRNITRNRSKRKRRNSRQMEEGGESPSGHERTEEPRRRSNTIAGMDVHRPIDDPIVSPVPPSVVRKYSQSSKTAQRRLDSETTKKAKEPEVVPPESLPSAEVSKPAAESSAVPQASHKREKQIERFRYGNFDRYYGSRLEGGGSDSDPRLSLMKKEWFEKMSVLDVGCNVGYVTLSIAKKFGPRRVVGIDIDDELVGIARKNIRHYCDPNVKFYGSFPASFSSYYGPFAAPSLSFSSKFPDNVWFRCENYVLENDGLLDAVKEEFDVILALSITKWIHLNWGDAGLKRFFRRAFLQLRPGGRFILEPQRFETYRRRAKFPGAQENLKSIKFLPDAFQEFLISEVGFETCDHLDPPKAKSKGFERPLQVYRKRIPKFLRDSKKGSSSVTASADADRKLPVSVKDGDNDSVKGNDQCPDSSSTTFKNEDNELSSAVGDATADLHTSLGANSTAEC